MITVEEFKSHFTRDFPYLPLWTFGKAYFTGDIVYDGVNFYSSLINNNLELLTNTDAWELVNVSVDSYLSNKDIQKAIDEAKLLFPADLFGEDYKIPFLYLTAYYLVTDIQNSTAGLSSNAYQSFVSSKSVGSVSESYGIPSWVNTDPIYGLLLANGYGKKFLTYLIPRARVGSIAMLSKGATTI